MQHGERIGILAPPSFSVDSQNLLKTFMEKERKLYVIFKGL